MMEGQDEIIKALPLWGQQKFVLRAFEEIDSTNQYALNEVEAGNAVPMLVWAGQQSAGRGRRGRDWQSPQGNIYASLLHPLDEDLASAARRGFVWSLAACQVMNELTGTDMARVKWPNDILLDGKKISGVLLEVAEAPDGSKWLVTGFGVNVATAPQNILYPAATLNSILPNATRTQVLAAILSAWARVNALYRAEGFLPVREAWCKLAAGIGNELTVRQPSGAIVTGIFSDLTTDGALALSVDGAVRHITAGDVFFPDMIESMGS